MVELRKRPAPPPAPPPSKKKTPAKTKGVAAAAAPQAEPETAAAPATTSAPAAAASAPATTNGALPAVGSTINLEGFGGEVTTHEGEATTLARLVAASAAGVVLFTYPKASTPGCTTQVCLFRDSYGPLTASGLAIYGLSNDSPKANTTFKTKQNLPYPLLCDPAQTLIRAIGLKKSPSGTTRGVFVVAKDGKVLAAEAGGPAATVDVVKAVVEKLGGASAVKDAGVANADDRAVAAVAAEVADTAAGMDKSKGHTPVPA